MKYRNLLAVAGLVVLFMHMYGCSEDSSPPVYTPDYGSQLTDSDGWAKITLSDFSYEVTLLDDDENPVPDATVKVFQGNKTALVYAEAAGRFPDFFITEHDRDEYEFTFHLYSVQGRMVDPDYIDLATFRAMYLDIAMVPHEIESDISTVYAMMAEEAAETYVVRVYGGAASKSDRSSMVLGVSFTDPDEFVFFNEFHEETGLLGSNVVGGQYYTINVGGTEYVLPVIHLDELVQ